MVYVVDVRHIAVPYRQQHIAFIQLNNQTDFFVKKFPESQSIAMTNAKHAVGIKETIHNIFPDSHSVML